MFGSNICITDYEIDPVTQAVSYLKINLPIKADVFVDSDTVVTQSEGDQDIPMEQVPSDQP